MEEIPPYAWLADGDPMKEEAAVFDFMSKSEKEIDDACRRYTAEEKRKKGEKRRARRRR
jgi:hypothetical protein